MKRIVTLLAACLGTMLALAAPSLAEPVKITTSDAMRAGYALVEHPNSGNPNYRWLSACDVAKDGMGVRAYALYPNMTRVMVKDTDGPNGVCNTIGLGKRSGQWPLVSVCLRDHDGKGSRPPYAPYVDVVCGVWAPVR
jgi:hypothetical protein